MATRVKRTQGWWLAACIACLGLGGCAASPMVRLTDLAGTQHQADAAYAHHDWRSAADGYRTLTRAVPDNAAYWFRLGNSYARLDQPQPAVDAYRAALQRNPHLAPAWHNLGAVLLQQAHVAFGEAATNAASADPLRANSALMAERIHALRGGVSGRLPPPRPKSNRSGEKPVHVPQARSDHKGGGT